MQAVDAKTGGASVASKEVASAGAASLPQIGKTMSNASAASAFTEIEEEKKESLEERKLRLEQFRQKVKGKKEEEKASAAAAAEKEKRDTGDVFRRTSMKNNESKD